MIALLVIIVGFTACIEVWSGKKKEQKEYPTPMLLLVATPLMALYAAVFYLSPSTIIVALVKYLTSSPAEFPAAWSHLEFADPVLKLALLFCLTDNFAAVMAYQEKQSANVQLMAYGLAMTLMYGGTMVLSWVLARVIAAGGAFDPVHVQAADSLFSVPIFAEDPWVNWMVIGFLLLLGASAYRLLITERKPT